jgi:membrane fusion protein, multidrug efflux system
MDAPMGISRRQVTVSFLVVLVLTVSGAGVYLRINGRVDGASAAATRAAADLPDVSASEQFSTDMAVPVEAADVRLDTLVLTVMAAAEAAAVRQTALKAQVPGQLRSVRVAENGAVGGGALLIEIDPTEYQLALEEARARLRETEARYREMTLGDDRMDDAALRAERDSAARARSGLDFARFAVSRAELNLGRARVVAPFPGRVANLRVVVGQHVGAGEELLTIQATDPIRVQAQVSQGEIGYLSPGRVAHISFAAFPGELFEGRVESINPIVEQQTRTARVTIAVRNAGGRILPGMYARAALPTQHFADCVLVPREAVLERDGRTMVFVFKGEGETGRAEWRYVNTGRMNDRVVEILEKGPEQGRVHPGERVLVDGHYSLTHDIPVRLVQSVRAEGGRPR